MDSPSKPSSTGWVILAVSLAGIIILLIIIWLVSSLFYTSNAPTGECSCTGEWGVLPGYGANVLNRCGTNGANPCVFDISSLSGATNLCDQVKDFCSAFTYNEVTGQMAIVDSSTSFQSPSVDLFVRQNGIIPR